MSEHTSTRPGEQQEGNDQEVYPFHYGHGRLPFFMKVAWVGFIILATYYIVAFLLTALGQELGA